jgi:peptidoglycan DL-endopeptidase CwlO
MRSGFGRVRVVLWLAVVVGVLAVFSLKVGISSFERAAGAVQRDGARRAGASAANQAANQAALRAASQAAAARKYAPLLATLGKKAGSSTRNAVAEAATALARAGQTEAVGARAAGLTISPGRSSADSTVPVIKLTGSGRRPRLARLGRLLQADLLVVAPTSLPSAVIAAIGRLPGVVAANLLDAAKIKVNGTSVATLGVDPATFREFAARPTATSTALWQNVADGGIAVSYLMGKQEKLPLRGTVKVTGSHTEQLPVAGFGTVGISGVDAVVSDTVARSLGFPAGNAIVISAPQARLSDLIGKIQQLLPKGAAVAPLVGQAAEHGLAVTLGSAGAIGITAADGPGLTITQIRAFLTAALSRVGLPYLWGGAGPTMFDCSGLVQWSMHQAGLAMPRVAVDQAQTGPLIPVADLEPGDLLFYHTDPTAPEYISHVAIYLGNGLMEQAPEPGMDVQVVPAILGGPEFAGAIEIYPRVAAAVAADPAG